MWYSIENPDKVTIYNIKGDVESIERTEGNNLFHCAITKYLFDIR